MNKTTLKALKGSIRKWERIVDGTARDEGSDNCPLCKMFFERFCKGCLVAEETENTYCDGTPYQDKWVWHEPSEMNGNGGYVHTKESLAAAKAELKFLKSLLPKDA